MFTGLIEEIGTVATVQFHEGSAHIAIICATILQNLQMGDSISVNGVCLTTTAFNSKSFSATATPETLACTNLSVLREGVRVNLERSLTLQSRLGGHMVQGHIDCTGQVVAISDEGESQRWTFSAPPEILKQMVHKGSVTVNGVSLTVASLEKESFSVALIPKTLELTTFQFIGLGETINLEVDIIGKYIHRFMEQAGII